MNPSLSNLTKVAVLGLLAWLIYSFLLDSNGYLHQRELEREIASKQKTVDSLNQRVRILNDSIRLLQTDSATLIRIARAKLGMSKPGEKLFRLIPSGDPALKGD